MVEWWVPIIAALGGLLTAFVTAWVTLRNGTGSNENKLREDLFQETRLLRQELKSVRQTSEQEVESVRLRAQEDQKQLSTRLINLQTRMMSVQTESHATAVRQFAVEQYLRGLLIVVRKHPDANLMLHSVDVPFPEWLNDHNPTMPLPPAPPDIVALEIIDDNTGILE